MNKVNKNAITPISRLTHILREIFVSGTLLTLIPPLMSTEVEIHVSEKSARGNCIVLGLGRCMT